MNVKKIDIPTDILFKLSDYYNTSIDYILCRTNNKNPYKKSEKYDKIMSRWLIYGKLSK